MPEAYIYDHVRTPRGRGKADGALHEVTALKLATVPLQALKDRNNLPEGSIDDVVLGVVDPVGEAGSDIARFAALKAVVSQLRTAGHRLGLLSNTCDMHYDLFADGRYEPIPAAFDVTILSYKLKQMNPQPEIYLEAARQAGVAPEEIFYVDDLPANIEGAKRVGFDAVLLSKFCNVALPVRSTRLRGCCQ